MGAWEFVQGPLARTPHRVGKELDQPYLGVYPAHLMREWRILYVIDEVRHRVTIRAVGHRRDIYGG